MVSKCVIYNQLQISLYFLLIEITVSERLPIQNIPLIYERTALYFIFENIELTEEYKNCEIVALPKIYKKSPVPFTFQKDSPYWQIFNYYLIRMKENSAEMRFDSLYKPIPQFCPDLTGEPLGFESMISAFLVFIVGFAMVLTILIFECLLKNRVLGTSLTSQKLTKIFFTE